LPDQAIERRGQRIADGIALVGRQIRLFGHGAFDGGNEGAAIFVDTRQFCLSDSTWTSSAKFGCKPWA
jgi:hypothetical protein